MANGKSGGAAETVRALVTPVLAELGLRVWDVRFEKEGPDWFLRVLIDRDEPIDLVACETASRAIDPILDEADPIDHSYFLEVGSPGLGRRLSRDEHFETMRGREITAHLIRADESGERDVTGILVGKDGPAVTIRTEDGAERVISTKDASWFKLHDDIF